MLRLTSYLVLLSFLTEASCFAGQLCVHDLTVPGYPNLAKMAQIEGRVTVSIEIAADGKVISAKATGGHEVLLRATERSVREWSFWPPAGVKEFPVRHSITYIYRIVGKPVLEPPPPTVLFHLPDTVEITAQPPELQPNRSR